MKRKKRKKKGKKRGGKGKKTFFLILGRVVQAQRQPNANPTRPPPSVLCFFCFSVSSAVVGYARVGVGGYVGVGRDVVDDATFGGRGKQRRYDDDCAPRLGLGRRRRRRSSAASKVDRRRARRGGRARTSPRFVDAARRFARPSQRVDASPTTIRAIAGRGHPAHHRRHVVNGCVVVSSSSSSSLGLSGWRWRWRWWGGGLSRMHFLSPTNEKERMRQPQTN